MAVRSAVPHHPVSNTLEADMSAWDASIDAALEDDVLMKRRFDDDDEENFDEDFDFDEDEDELDGDEDDEFSEDDEDD